jgi:ornithine carbamoyltransferase
MQITDKSQIVIKTVTAEKMALTNNAKFMHCLPVRRVM